MRSGTASSVCDIIHVYIYIYIYIIWSPELFSANRPSRVAGRTVSKPPGLSVMKSPDDIS